MGSNGGLSVIIQKWEDCSQPNIMLCILLTYQSGYVGKENRMFL